MADYPEVFESKPEAKAFMIFLEMLENSNNGAKIQHHDRLREKIKIKIPGMKSIEEFKHLYSKTFLQTKKYFNILKFFIKFYSHK